MPSVNEINKESVVMYKDEPHIVVEFQHVNPGKGGSFVRTRLKNARTGKVFENTYKAAESVEFVDLERRNLQYTYNDGKNWFFMDQASFEEIFIPKEVLAEKANYLKEGQEIQGFFYEGECLNVVLPKKMVLKVTEAFDAVKGDSSGNITKEVTLETGYKIKVPIFIKEGDLLSINTDTGEYVERANQ
ncbi:MAG: elongation factor P [Patescibacteria group bacterium]|nr:MAG: elongation factor P [Patescibacteria group bacterium]